MKSILKQAQEIFYIKEEFKTLFSKKKSENKPNATKVVKEKAQVLEEEFA